MHPSWYTPRRGTSATKTATTSVAAAVPHADTRLWHKSSISSSEPSSCPLLRMYALLSRTGNRRASAPRVPFCFTPLPSARSAELTGASPLLLLLLLLLLLRVLSLSLSVLLRVLFLFRVSMLRAAAALLLLSSSRAACRNDVRRQVKAQRRRKCDSMPKWSERYSNGWSGRWNS